MKQLLFALTLLITISAAAQTNLDLKKHYEAYYKEMKKQGDVRGIINALTHLNVIEPSLARKDTLAYLYLSEGQYREALNTIGIEKNATDSDMNVEVKALALKNLNQTKLALEHFEIMFKRKPNAYLAYEMADMKIQVQDFEGAKANITYGLANAKAEDKRVYYESQQPYEASLKAGLTYLNALLLLNQNQNNLDGALKLLNDALTIDPNFNLAKVVRESIERKKAQDAAATKN